MKRVYINKDICMGCGLCRVHCCTEHSESKDMIKAHNKEAPRPLPRIRVERKGSLSFSVQCHHCDDPWCVYSCLTGAMSRDPESGLVTSDKEKCIGCWTCLLACPYGALSRDDARKMVLKCDLCQGREIPACVTNCPNEALILYSDEEEAPEEMKK